MKKLLTVLLLMVSMISQAQVVGVDVLADKFVSSPEYHQAVKKMGEYNNKLDYLLSNDAILREKFDADLNRIFSKLFKDRADEMTDLINNNKNISTLEIGNKLEDLTYNDFTSLMILANKYRNSKSTSEQKLGTLIMDVFTDFKTNSYCLRLEIPDGDKYKNQQVLDIKTVVVNKQKISFVNFNSLKHISGIYDAQYNQYCFPIISKYR